MPLKARLQLKLRQLNGSESMSWKRQGTCNWSGKVL